MSRSLEDLEADCGRWRELSTALVTVGQSAITASRACAEMGWEQEATAFSFIAAGVARLLAESVLPNMEAHHAEHYQARCEVQRLEDELGEAS